ncbi:MAG TPA: hypothetical protein VMV23_02540, partial [Candidatus Nanopelagicaceae bacterium]|nr:hypothetical protein [Candidatus Nanopelagicaceae bacterium]
RFAVRDNPEKNSAVNLYVRATEALVTAIQAPKHTRRATDERALAPVALTVEGLLHFLLVE